MHVEASVQNTSRHLSFSLPIFTPLPPLPSPLCQSARTHAEHICTYMYILQFGFQDSKVFFQKKYTHVTILYKPDHTIKFSSIYQNWKILCFWQAHFLKSYLLILKEQIQWLRYLPEIILKNVLKFLLTFTSTIDRKWLLREFQQLFKKLPIIEFLMTE